MKSKKLLPTVSNIIFLFPLYLTLAEGRFLYASVIFLVFLFSFIYHFFRPAGDLWIKDLTKLSRKERAILLLDKFFACILVFINFFTITEKGFPLFGILAVIVAIPAIYIFLLQQKKHYYVLHSIWHILSGIITLLAVLA